MDKENSVRGQQRNSHLRALDDITNVVKQKKTLNTPEKKKILGCVSIIEKSLENCTNYDSKPNAAEDQRVEPVQESANYLTKTEMMKLLHKSNEMFRTDLNEKFNKEIGDLKTDNKNLKADNTKIARLETDLTDLKTKLDKETKERLLSEKKAEARIQHLVSNMQKFSATKILSSMQNLEQTYLSASNILVYAQMSEEEANYALHHGVLTPIIGTSDVTTGSPAVVAMILPVECVVILREENDRKVFSVPSRLLSIFGSDHVPARCIKQVIMVDEDVDGLDKVQLEEPFEALPLIPFLDIPVDSVTITSVAQLLSLMKPIAERCIRNGTYFVFHYTMEEYLPSILEGGVKTSTDGQGGGGGGYASTSGPGSHNVGSPEYEDSVLNDNYGKELAQENRGKADGVVVIEVPAQSLSLVNQRENAVMFGRRTIETIGYADDEINYYLNPKHIIACFVIKSSNIVHCDNDEEIVNQICVLEKHNKDQLKEAMAHHQKSALRYHQS